MIFIWFGQSLPNVCVFHLNVCGRFKVIVRVINFFILLRPSKAYVHQQIRYKSPFGPIMDFRLLARYLVWIEATYPLFRSYTETRLYIGGSVAEYLIYLYG